jgi:endonuclease/exonuclease/phosphatase family metal-dependent hydrolase
VYGPSVALRPFVLGDRDVDHVFVKGLSVASGGAAVLDRGRLSDHAPVRVVVLNNP